MGFWWSKKKQAAEGIPVKEPYESRVEIDTNAIFLAGSTPASQGVLDPRWLDPGSSTWRFVKAWAEDQLIKAREKNDNTNKDFTQTSVLRGEIRMLKTLISLPNPKKGLLMTDEED